MKLQPVLIALTAVNLAILGYLTLRTRAEAATPATAQMLRGKGLEIVDDAGKVRASITLFPAARQKDGSIYPETVLLRLINSHGKPTVKISSLDDGAAMSLGSDGPAYAQILARDDKPVLNLIDRDGKHLAP